MGLKHDLDSNGHLIYTHMPVKSSSRKREKISKDQNVPRIRVYLVDAHMSVDASDLQNAGMSEVENVQTIQNVTMERETPEIKSTAKHGEDILLPPSVTFREACIWNSFYIFIILVTSISLTIPATLFPLHNLMRYPKYWWEMIPAYILSISVYDSLNVVLECQMIFTFETFKSIKVFLRLYSINVLSTILTVVMCYNIWTVWMGNIYPIPFLGAIFYVVSNITQSVALWFQFPGHLRIEKNVRGRIWSYLLYRQWFRFYGIQLLGIKMMMSMLPLKIQWIVAIILPIHREMNLWVIFKLLEKSTDYNTTDPLIPKLTATALLNTGHAGSVATLISALSTDITAYSILAVDFMINMLVLHKIIKLHRKILPTMDARENDKRMIEKTEKIMQLFVIETVEFLAPIVYSVTFAMAYYGPNAEMIGTVKGNFWTFKAIDDMTSFQFNLFRMFVIDCTSAIISGLALWKFTSINFLKEGYKMMKIFFPLLSIRFGGIYVVVCYF